jgi:hypothetical protein
LAADLVGAPRPGRSATNPSWLFPCLFGFLHGLGIASPFVGFDATVIATRLPVFCGTFLIGQFILVDAVLLALEWFGRRGTARDEWVQFVGYACGGVAAFYVIDRLMATMAL